MKTILTFGLVLSFLFHATMTCADTFIETIADVSATDAVVVQNNELFASNYNTGQVFRIGLDGSFSEVLGTNTRGPAGIRFDSNDNMYIAMYNINTIIRIDPQGNETVFVNNIREPIALDWDSQENLYVSHFAGLTTVTQISPSGEQTAIASISELSAISSLCLDSNDDIYVTSYESGDIYKASSNGDVSLFASTPYPGFGFLQFDETNNLFYATVFSGSAIVSIAMDGTVTEIIDSNPTGTQDGPVDIASVQNAIGIAVSDNGNEVYFASNTQLRRVLFADPSVDQVRPYFTNSVSASAEESADFNFSFVVTDPNNDPLTITVDNVPAWLTFDGIDSLSGAPASADANMSFRLVANASDGIDSVSQPLTITVSAATPTPAPTPTPTPSTPVSNDDNGGGGAIPVWLLLLIVVGHYYRTRKQ